MSTCKHCGSKLETEKEVERGICQNCLKRGFNKLSDVLRKLRKKHGGF